MTNKNKKTLTAKLAKISKAEKKADDVRAPSIQQEPALKTFTKAQIAALIFVVIGSSKIMEFSAALEEGTADPISCMNYLDHEETCTHPSFPSMILVKYYSAISLTFLVLSSIRLLWLSETLFLKFMTCLSISPLSTTVLACVYGEQYVQPGRVWHLIMMSGVLFATCIPTSAEHLAFLPNGPWTTRSLQSLTLMALVATCVWDILRVARNSETTSENSLLTTLTPLPEPARALVRFWMVDKLSMALVFAFAVVHFPERTQRTFLLNVAMLKLGEVFYQLPRMTDPFQDIDTVQQVMLGSAILAGAAWAAPRMDWK